MTLLFTQPEWTHLPQRRRPRQTRPDAAQHVGLRRKRAKGDMA